MGEGWRAPASPGRVGGVQTDFYHWWTIQVGCHGSLNVGLFLFKLKRRVGELGRGRKNHHPLLYNKTKLTL